MKKLRTFLFNIDYWLYKNSPIYIGYDILFILSEWWIARKIFKFPYISFTKNNYYIPDNKYKLLDITTYRLSWKWKYNDICFEREPKIEITIFNKFQYIIILNSPAYSTMYSNAVYLDNNTYWETMLNYIYKYEKDFIKTYNNFGWVNCNFIEYENKKYNISIPSWNWNCFTKNAINQYGKDCKRKEITMYNFK